MLGSEALFRHPYLLTLLSGHPPPRSATLPRRASILLDRVVPQPLASDLQTSRPHDLTSILHIRCRSLQSIFSLSHNLT